MHARYAFSIFAGALALAACSTTEPSLIKADCHSCTVKEEEWKDFSFASLAGSWKGEVDNTRNDRSAVKKEKDDKVVAFKFLRAEDFFRTQKSKCTSVAADAMVMNGLFWTAGAVPDAKGAREYETFEPTEDGHVAYGRISFDQLNGRKVCRFRRLGRVMGKNRMALPTASFSDESAYPARALASSGNSTERTVEFLRFEPITAKPLAFDAGLRKPASVAEREIPPLMIRVSTMTAHNDHKRGQWIGTQEEIFRLWRTQ